MMMNRYMMGPGFGNWENMPDYMKEMMRSYAVGGGGALFRIGWIFELVIWILVVVLLIALIRWIWRKGDGK